MVGLLMLQKPLPVFNGEPIWFILTNGNHPMSKVSHSVLLGRKLNQNQPFYQFRNLLHQDRSLKTIKSPFSLLLRYLISLCFCFRLSEAFNSTFQTKKLKIQTCISNTAENLFDRCGENKKYFRHIFRLMKKIEFYFTLFTSRSKYFLSILTSGWQPRWYEQRHLVCKQLRALFYNGQFCRQRQNFLFE